uniref:tRNA-uridine aminocarboxypropyltransferase n=1 Tax=Amblyomma triste TaxID=251400 RepID=A0A023GKG0_AMBTT
MATSEDEIEAFCHLGNILADPPPKRDLCNKCRRPPSVCWCCSLPESPVMTASKVYILQHPGEVKRNLSTAPMLEAALSSERCIILRGRRFSRERCRALEDILDESASADTILLYPGPEARDVQTLATVQQRGRGYNIVVLDGTWSQARSLFFNSPQLHSLLQVQVNASQASHYVIRTQPTSECLSTVETVAYALAALEGKPHLQEVLTRPLQTLCRHQLEHGAVTHQSKEFLIQNGLYMKPLSRRIIHKLARNEDLKDALK